MAAPPRRTIVPRSRARRPGLRLATTLTAAGLLLPALGCGLVPRSKLDECHQLTQTLRADNGRLKDVALDLRAQNQDLSQRAVEDAQRLTAQDEAIERLEKSVTAYQKERDELATAFEEMRRQVRLSVGPSPADGTTTSAGMESDRSSPGTTVAAAEPPPILDLEETARASSLNGTGNGTGTGDSPPAPDAPDSLAGFAEARRGAGWRYDPASGTLSAESGALFEPGTARLTPEGTSALSALAGALKASLRDGEVVELVGRADPKDAAVRRATLEGQADADGSARPSASASNRFLGAARGAQVRDKLVSLGGLDPTLIRLSAPTTGADPEGAGGRAAIRLRLAPSAGLDAPGGVGR